MHIPVIPALFRLLLPKGIVWQIKSEKKLYLTFDDGPIPEVTPIVLQILKEFNARATFFCVGNNISKYPMIYQQIIENGHSAGNHTFSHLNGLKTPKGNYYEDIEQCDSLIKSRLFRPPHGKMTLAQFKYLRKRFSIIMWSVLSGDYNQKLSKEKVLSNVLKYSRDGSIIVFHDSLKAADRMLYALPQVLKYFSEKGYKFEKIQTINKHYIL